MSVRTTFTMVISTMCFVAGGLLGAPQPVRAQSSATRPSVVIRRAPQAIAVDGALDDVAWKDAQPFELAYEVEPGENVPPPVRTEVMLVYTSTHLYVAFRCFDPQPRDIRANYSDRDHIGTNDRVALEIDTFSDRRRAFVFGSNALGVQWDAVHAEANWDDNWDAIWDSAGRRYDWGYAVELAIPFDQLRFPKQPGALNWAIDASRVYPRRVEHTIGAFARDRNNNCYHCQMLDVTGLEGAKPGKSVELSPSITAVRTDVRRDIPHGAFATDNQDAQVGATLKWGITPNLTAQGTVNPDFSQIEADALQLDINQPFALFYREKRPFFTEGADYFDSLANRVIEDPLLPISTRTIRDPEWGAKLTGKQGGNVLGAFVVRDAITNLIIPGAEQSRTVSIPVDNYSSIFRYRRDVGNQYSFGTTATSRESGDYFNRVVGVDGDFRLTDRDRLVFNLLGSTTRYSNEIARQSSQSTETFSDRLWMVHYRHGTRTYNVYADYQDVGRGFRADLGYIPRVGFTKGEVGTGYTWWRRETSFVNRVQFSGNLDQTRRQDGGLMERELELMVSARGPLQSTVFTYYGARDRVYEGVRFGQDFKGVFFGMRPSNAVQTGTLFAFEDKIDYAHSRPASEFMAQQELDLQVTEHLRWSMTYMYLTLDVRGGRLFRVHAAETAAIYQLNRRAFARAVVQYTDTAQSQELYARPVEPNERSLFLQLLWSYTINPRTVAFLGYSGDLIGQRDFGLAQTSRTVFLKVGYALTR